MNIRKKVVIGWIILLAVFIGIIAINTTLVNASYMSDKQIVKEYCNKHYKGYTIKYFTKWNDKTMSHRANKKIVYVQIEKSISSGKIDKRNGRYWGYVKGQYFYKTWYNAKVNRGKEVKSYYIFNPYSNYEDDIVAVVDCKKIR